MKSHASRRRHRFVRSVRAQGALTAYQTALRFVRMYPIADVEQLLKVKIKHCEHEVAAAEAKVAESAEATR